MKRKCQGGPFPVFRPESVDISLYPDKVSPPLKVVHSCLYTHGSSLPHSIVKTCLRFASPSACGHANSYTRQNLHHYQPVDPIDACHAKYPGQGTIFCRATLDVDRHTHPLTITPLNHPGYSLTFRNYISATHSRSRFGDHRR
eukprot:1832621-Pleurochrysis_carterae.AAC.1